MVLSGLRSQHRHPDALPGSVPHSWVVARSAPEGVLLPQEPRAAPGPTHRGGSPAPVGLRGQKGTGRAQISWGHRVPERQSVIRSFIHSLVRCPPGLRSSSGQAPLTPGSGCVDQPWPRSPSRPREQPLSQETQRGEGGQALRLCQRLRPVCSPGDLGCRAVSGCRALSRLGCGQCPCPPILGCLLLKGWGAFLCEVLTPLLVEGHLG